MDNRKTIKLQLSFLVSNSLLFDLFSCNSQNRVLKMKVNSKKMIERLEEKKVNLSGKQPCEAGIEGMIYDSDQLFIEG